MQNILSFENDDEGSYVRYSDNRITKTEMATSLSVILNIDYDVDGNIVGIEIIP